MNSELTGKAMVFAKKFDDRVAYSIGLSKKMNGEWISGYIPANFRKGVTLENQTKIIIEKGWLDFYINKENKTVPTLFISEFSLEAKNPPEEVEGFSFIDEDIPF
mgnify:CR=1 FL=1